MLKLKLDYKEATGKEWESQAARGDSKQKAAKPEETKKTTQSKPEEGTRYWIFFYIYAMLCFSIRVIMRILDWVSR